MIPPRKAEIDPVTELPGEKGRRVATPGAMVADLVARLQRIAEKGDDGTVPQLAQLIPEVMQPGKGEGSDLRPAAGGVRGRAQRALPGEAGGHAL